MGSGYGGSVSTVTGIFVKNWIKADGPLKPQTGVIRFSLLNSDGRMIALDDTWKESTLKNKLYLSKVAGL